VYPSWSLDQLTAFVTEVEEGSFSAAGRRLGRVQSAVSYAIGQLEEGLGSQLFDRSGRTPTLTRAGRRLAAEARLVLAQARDLSEAAARLQEGIEPVLRVVVDVIYPQERLVDTCRAFQQAFPSTTLRLESALLDDAVEAVRSGRADLGACNLAGATPAGLSLAWLGTVPVVPVCAPEHELAHAQPPHRESLLRSHVQIVQTERLQAPTQDQGVLAARTWRVSDMGLKLDLIRRGTGWGSLPLDLVHDDLQAGRLVRLHPEPWPDGGHVLPLHAVTQQDTALGRAGQWFRERLPLGAQAVSGATATHR